MFQRSENSVAFETPYAGALNYFAPQNFDPSFFHGGQSRPPFAPESGFMPNPADFGYAPVHPNNPGMYNTPGTYNTGPLRTKTKLCIHFSRHGQCAYADKCGFAHGTRELGGNSNTSNVMPIPSLSSKIKTVLCANFSSSGSCKYGAKCTFAHGPEELQQQQFQSFAAPPAQRLPISGKYKAPYKTKLCSRFQNLGSCHLGSNCTFAHGARELARGAANAGTQVLNMDLYKTKICDGWAAGECVNGDKCTFAHGEEELNPIDTKKVTCKWFLRGLCNFGETCQFSHDPDSDKRLMPRESDPVAKRPRVA